MKQKEFKGYLRGFGIILLSLLSFVVIMLFIIGIHMIINPNSQFVINQEVCHNETYHCNYNFNPENVTILVIDAYDTDIEKEEIFKSYCEDTGGSFIESIEVCEKQEVDEMYYEYDCWDNQYYEECPTDGRPCGDGGCSYINISKEDLTKEWLDENCLVTKVYSKLSNEGYLCNVGEGTECALDICQDKNYECSEYKCGDYTVEVLR